MKVKTWVELTQEVDVDVSISDVMGAISELAEGDQEGMLLDCISNVHRVLRSIQDERIAVMNVSKRRIISAALKVESDRFLLIVPTIDTGTSPTTNDQRITQDVTAKDE